VLDPRVASLRISPTLAARTASGELATEGRRVHRLGLGQSPFPVPTPVVHAMRAAATERDYLPPGGLGTLRTAVAEFHRRRHGHTFASDDIVIGPGSKMLMFLLQLCFDGDILIPTPRWVSYEPQARLVGRRLVSIPPGGRHGLMIAADDLRRICAADPGRSRMLFLNSPSNPTGLSYTRDELTELAAVCRDYQLVVLADEIYADLEFTGHHASIALDYPERTIVASGLSKWCGAGGWRLGTLAFPELLRPLREAVEAVGSETYSSTSAPIQHAAIIAFRPSAELDAYVVAERRILAGMMRWATSQLAEGGIEVAPPAGGFYLFPTLRHLIDRFGRAGIPDDRALVERLRADLGLVCLPGSAFGMDPHAFHIRLALVDFDGAAALSAAGGGVHHEFIARYLPSIREAIEALARWAP